MDFDGLVCAVLLNELDMIDDIKFVHPKDMQDGKIDIGPRDITTNLPYVPGARTSPSTTTSRNHPQHRRADQPRDRPERTVGGARRL